MRDQIKKLLNEASDDFVRTFYNKDVMVWLCINGCDKEHIYFTVDVTYPQNTHQVYERVFVDPFMMFLKAALRGVAPSLEHGRFAGSKTKFDNVVAYKIPKTIHPAGTRGLKGLKVKYKAGNEIWLVDEAGVKKIKTIEKVARFVAKKYNLPIKEKIVTNL